jgi:SsrA-binding protein
MSKNKRASSSSPAPAAVLTNRKARRDYEFIETLEAGIVLAGTEVKSLRAGRGNLSDAFARIEKEQVWLYNCDIQPYEQGNRFNHQPKAPRKLLLHKNEIRHLHGSVTIKGRSLIPLEMYWKSNRLKIRLGLGVAKKDRDKREDLKRRVQEREIDQAMKESRRGGGNGR